MLKRDKIKKRMELRKAVVDWLWERSQKPDGLGIDVGMELRRDRVDVAALWLRKGGEGLAARGTVFVCCPERRDCWPSCSTSENILKELVELRRQREALERRIREEEPELRADDLLFDELSIWNYEKSGNAEYQELRGRIEELEKMLYSGTLLERIGKEGICSGQYVVVPAGLLNEMELREDWGLIWVSDGKVELRRESRLRAVNGESGLLLIKRVLNSNAEARQRLLGPSRP